MKRFTLSAAAALIAVGLVAGAAAPAMADEQPPVDEPIVQVEESAPADETTPAEEPVTAPVAAEPEAEAPAPPVTPPAAQEPTPPVEETTPVVDEEVTPPVIEQFYIGRWVLPNGGTPENVTWPQPVFDPAAIPCGTSVWLQIDQYPYLTDEDKARTDAMFADGILTQGEDYGWVVGWTFEQYTAPDCEVPPAAANPTAVITAVCGEATFTLTNPLIADANQLTASFVVNVDGEFYGAYAVAAGDHFSETVTFAEDTGDHAVEVYQAGTSEWKLLDEATTTSDCVLPPVVEPPVVEPPVVEPPVVVPPVTAAVVTPVTGSTDTLAQTGGSGDSGFLGLASILLIAGLSVMGVRRLARR